MRVLVFNQYYPPDTAATAQRLADLCRGLARHHDVTVICGRPSYDPVPEEASEAGAVRVLRVPSSRFHRSRMLGRLSNYASYVALALLRGLTARRPDVVVAMTDPPVIGLVALLVAARARARSLFIIQDLYPDVAVALGKVTSPLVVRFLERVTRLLLRRADVVVAISASMRDRLVAKGAAPGKVRVISNWADTDVLAPEPKDNEFSCRHGLTGRFVVAYSGNVGLSQNLRLLVEAAARLRDVSDLRVVIIGEGAAKAGLVSLARDLGATNVLFLGYQPLAEMRYSFAAADVLVVPLSGSLDGLVVPSKVFAVMASGRPFIAAVDETSEVAEIVRRHACGVLVKPDSLDEMVAAIEWASRNRETLRVMGDSGRRAAEAEYSAHRAVARYAAVLAELEAPRKAADCP